MEIATGAEECSASRHGHSEGPSHQHSAEASPLAANSPEGGIQGTSFFVQNSSRAGPHYLPELLCCYSPTRGLWSCEQDLLMVTGSRTRTHEETAFEKATPVLWNRLPLSTRMASSLNCLSVLLRHTFLTRRIFGDWNASKRSLIESFIVEKRGLGIPNDYPMDPGWIRASTLSITPNCKHWCTVPLFYCIWFNF